MTALGYVASERRITVRFTRVIDMINRLTTAQINGTLELALKSYLKPSLLLLDELGYLPIDKRGADLLFQLSDGQQSKMIPRSARKNRMRRVREACIPKSTHSQRGPQTCGHCGRRTCRSHSANFRWRADSTENLRTVSGVSWSRICLTLFFCYPFSSRHLPSRGVFASCRAG